MSVYRAIGPLFCFSNLYIQQGSYLAILCNSMESANIFFVLDTSLNIINVHCILPMSIKQKCYSSLQTRAGCSKHRECNDLIKISTS